MLEFAFTCLVFSSLNFAAGHFFVKEYEKRNPPLPEFDHHVTPSLEADSEGPQSLIELLQKKNKLQSK